MWRFRIDVRKKEFLRNGYKKVQEIEAKHLKPQENGG